MNTREDARAALEAYLDASKALRDIIGVGEKLEPGRPPTAKRITRETLKEWDEAEERERVTREEWRAAAQRMVEDAAD